MLVLPELAGGVMDDANQLPLRGKRMLCGFRGIECEPAARQHEQFRDLADDPLANCAAYERSAYKSHAADCPACAARLRCTLSPNSYALHEGPFSSNAARAS